jgi:hypothetical protein
LQGVVNKKGETAMSGNGKKDKGNKEQKKKPKLNIKEKRKLKNEKKKNKYEIKHPKMDSLRMFDSGRK